MDRRTFIERFGVAGAGIMISPAILAMKPAKRVCETAICKSDIIIVPTGIGTIWRACLVVEATDKSLEVMPLQVVQENFPTMKKGDVFLHVTWTREIITTQEYAHYEEEAPHQLYEMVEDPETTKNSFILKYKPSNI